MDDKEYPKWMYGPGGEKRIFQRDEQVPKGWQDHPSKVKEKNATKTAGGTTPPQRTEQEEKDRQATLDSLREAGVEIADDATDDEINDAIDKLTGNTGE